MTGFTSPAKSLLTRNAGKGQRRLHHLISHILMRSQTHVSAVDVARTSPYLRRSFRVHVRQDGLQDDHPAHTLAIDVATKHILNDAVTTANRKTYAFRARTVHARPTHSPHNYTILHRTAVTPHAARHRLDADTIALAEDAPCTRDEHAHTLTTHMRRPWRDVTATHTQPHKTHIVHRFGCGPARTRKIIKSI